MPTWGYLSAAEQFAAFLREELFRGRWGGNVPGVGRLAEEFAVNHKTVRAALQQLEVEGFVEGQGAGRQRRIIFPSGVRAIQSLHVGLFHHETIPDQKTDYIIELQHALKDAGHITVIADKSLLDLRMDVNRVARQVRSMDVDAWIINAGSAEVLSWFAERPSPAFAIFGRQEGLPIAGVKPRKPEAFASAIHRLTELGHRRIVLLVREMRRIPHPGRLEQSFLDELKAQGISTGKFNLPDWEDSSEGFQAVLESLFQVTPPTALLIDESFLFTAALQFLAHRGIRVPEDVSLICTDHDPVYTWCTPSVAHVAWETRPAVRRAVRWAANVSRGRTDLRQTLVPASYVDGGTVGPVKKA